jgi:hypothetical protein
MPYIAQVKPTKIYIMKKTLAVLALALFIGGISVPAIAASNNTLTLISLQEDDPKKKEKKAEKKAATSKEATKSGDCSSEKKSDCSK